MGTIDQHSKLPQDCARRQFGASGASREDLRWPRGTAFNSERILTAWPTRSADVDRCRCKRQEPHVLPGLPPVGVHSPPPHRLFAGLCFF